MDMSLDYLGGGRIEAERGRDQVGVLALPVIRGILVLQLPSRYLRKYRQHPGCRPDRLALCLLWR